MSFVAALFAPLAILLPLPVAAAPTVTAQQQQIGENRVEVSVFRQIAESFLVPGQNQVRIEQRMTIRITPQAAPPPPASLLMDLPQRPSSVRPTPPRIAEREMGRCLSIAGIAGVQVGQSNRLILYMRDRRVISAALERSCSARDYYSGFYVERNADGQICVRRDSLLSRSGANCRLTRLSQLVDTGD